MTPSTTLACTVHGALDLRLEARAPWAQTPRCAVKDYVGAFRANGEFHLAVQAIRSRRVDVRPLISAQLPLSRAQEAFELALDRARSTQVQLVPNP